MTDDTVKRLALVQNKLESGGGGGGDDDMEKRLTAVEQAIVRIDATLEFMRENMATKAFVSDAVNGQIKWIVGTAAVLGGAAIVVMTFVLNNAIPKTQGTAQAPITINMAPPAVAPQAAAPASAAVPASALAQQPTKRP